MCTNVVCFRVLDGKSYTAAWYHRPGTFSILNCQLVKEGWRFIALLCTFFFLLLSLRCNVVQILFSFNGLFFVARWRLKVGVKNWLPTNVGVGWVFEEQCIEHKKTTGSVILMDTFFLLQIHRKKCWMLRKLI